ncbi:RNA polymerase sigma factor (sigma-70 family) [Solirubrobacter pauli]|uniref:RNA polymerase sigma factor (Sigma-70 family) n=1 Tax=Solirubrobacter pauli TaxID=166793 RepID=A0A660L2X2_9ACTN|nr:RNA polymerase sigma factor (sigma-70 family) [Solirubrobacter pauli]
MLRRQAARLLRGSGHDPDDVIQDVYLRADAALRGGVVPIDARAWLLRLVRNAALDELRRAKVRAVGGVELETLPSAAGQLPEVLLDRTEARELLGDIHRLPDRQKSVLVMSALDGLSHEEVAVRLDTTVDTTRSLLARARANLRQTAEARETSCVSVRDALDVAAESGVRASELARRHLWSCAGCRAHQALLRERPSRLRRLAGWSPWGVLAQLVGGGGVATVQKVAVGACCALVVGGSAVTVPVVKHHASEAPQVAMVTPADLDAAAPKRPRRPHAPAPAAPVVAVDTPPSTASTESARIAVPTKPKTAKSRPKARRVPTARPRRFDDRALYNRAVQAFMRTNPTAEERQAFFAGARKFHASPPGSRARRSALLRLAQQAYTKPVRPAPPKGLKPVPTPVATPVATPVETPTPVPTPVETATPVPTVVETPTPVATPTATPTETASPVATP